MLRGSLLQLLLGNCNFLNTDILQDSVATLFMCGGIFKQDFIFFANLPLSLPVKEFRKSVNIWESYGQEFSVFVFLTHGVYIFLCHEPRARY